MVAHYLIEKTKQMYIVLLMKVASFLLIPYKYGLGNFLSMIRKVFIKSYNTGARIHVPRQCEACLIIEPFLDTMLVSFAPWIHQGCGREIWSETWGQVLEGGRRRVMMLLTLRGSKDVHHWVLL